MRTQKLVACLLVGSVTLVFGSGPGRTQFGGPNGGGRRGGRRMFGGPGSGDPNVFFNRLSGGKDLIVRAQLADPFSQRLFDRIAGRMGITNGQITRAQYLEYSRQRGMGRAGTGAPASSDAARIDRRAEASFRRQDVNGDGLLNYDEMPPALRSERDKWDANHDGFIDLNEYKAYYRAFMEQRQADRRAGQPGRAGWPIVIVPPPEEEDKRPLVYRAGKLPRELPAWFAQDDRDGDGQIGLYEWLAAKQPLAQFEAMDRNKDGFLTAEEVLRYEKDHPRQAVQGPANGGPSSPSFGRPRSR